MAIAEPKGIHRRLLLEVTGDVINRFWSKVDKGPHPKGCWLWMGADRGNGYGAMKIDGRVHSSHVVAFAIANGPQPDGTLVTHECDVRRCCNPDHLIAGTPKKNFDDMESRGRRVLALGERAGAHKLTEAEVRDARRLKAEGATGAQIARIFGVDKSTINNMLRGESWSHVSD